MTQSLERRLLRQSLDNQLNISTYHDRPGRHSLTSISNKENFGIHFIRNSFINKSTTALHDLSNGKSPIRPEPSIENLRRQESPSNIKTFSQRGRLVTISPQTNRVPCNILNSIEDDLTPLTHMKFPKNIQKIEESLSSSMMGDSTLDRMLDAIIESARKEVTPKKNRPTTDLNNTTLLYGADADNSIHEMEVRTPTHLKRQKVVRRKKQNSTQQNMKHKTTTLEGTCQVKTASKLSREKTCDENQEPSNLNSKSGLESVINQKTPETPLFTLQNIEQTPEPIYYENITQINQRCSTPALEEAQSIKRCLSFSSTSDIEDERFLAKRSSVASSNASTITNEYFCSGSSVRTSQNSLKNHPIKGSIELKASIVAQQLNVHGELQIQNIQL